MIHNGLYSEIPSREKVILNSCHLNDNFTPEYFRLLCQEIKHIFMEKKKEEKGMLCTEDGCVIEGNTTESNFKSLFIQREPIGKIIYFGDPMCSWCWGITNDLERLRDHFKYELQFELVLGGLRPGGGDKWDDNMKEMLKGHWGHVNERTGQPFNYQIFSLKSFNYDTEPPSRAVRIVRDLAPKKEFDFFKELQRSFYVENLDLSKQSNYKSVCEKFEIPFGDFEQCFNSEKYKELVKDDFLKSAQYGVRGFPTVAVQINRNVSIIAGGYSNFENMKLRVEKVLGQELS